METKFFVSFFFSKFYDRSELTISVCCYLPNFMLLQLITSELGGGQNPPPPQVQRVFKRPGKIGLKERNYSHLLVSRLFQPHGARSQTHRVHRDHR